MTDQYEARTPRPSEYHCQWCGDYSDQRVNGVPFCSWDHVELALNPPCEPWVAELDFPDGSLRYTVRRKSGRQFVHRFIRELGTEAEKTHA